MAKSTKTTYINTELDYNNSFFSGIYKITNIKNGKFYIGSARSLYKRHSEHFEKLHKGSHKNPHLQSSFNKYGNVFKFEILKLCNFEELFNVEQYYIDVLNPQYNINKKATGRHLPHSLKTKLKISKSQYKKVNQYDDQGTLINKFNSLLEVFKYFNIPKTGGLSSHLTGKQRTFKGYFWCYDNSTPIIRQKKNRWHN